MIPVVTPAEMAEIDRAAPEPVEVLIERAGAAVARAAVRMMGGTYGRRVVVVAGKGNNGNDGRAAARRLARRGARVTVIDAAGAPDRLPDADLVIDAAYGTGFRGTWEPPELPPGVPVLAVDIPSGVSGLTGRVGGGAWAAARTVTFAACKPGLLLEPGRSLAGVVEVADIGLDTSGATAWVPEASDVVAGVPRRAPTDHKWRWAVLVVAGSPGMGGAAALAARAALRAGAGYVRLASPGGPVDAPTEVVQTPLPAEGWADAALADAGRFRAAVVGPGLGRRPETLAEVRRFLAGAPMPVVVDGDGLVALAGEIPARPRGAATVLTPHDGEFRTITGAPPPDDRLGAARSLAADADATVLLKGPTTVVADPDGAARFVAHGDARLATAGTGDVLAGIIAALLAGGAAPLDAAAWGAWLHASAPPVARGLVAGDLPDALPSLFTRLGIGP